MSHLPSSGAVGKWSRRSFDLIAGIDYNISWIHPIYIYKYIMYYLDAYSSVVVTVVAIAVSYLWGCSIFLEFEANGGRVHIVKCVCCYPVCCRPQSTPFGIYRPMSRGHRGGRSTQGFHIFLFLSGPRAKLVALPLAWCTLYWECCRWCSHLDWSDWLKWCWPWATIWMRARGTARLGQSSSRPCWGSTPSSEIDCTCCSRQIHERITES